MEGINTQSLQENDTLYVPHDIIENILIRLPVKSLLRFKAVSTKWEANISDPIFARFHLQQSKMSARQYIFIEGKKLCQREYENFKLIEMKNKEIQIDTELDYSGDLGDAHLMSYLDGLLLLTCFKEYSGRGIILYALWNPSTTAFIMFRCPYPLCYWSTLYGFCYDPWSHDYKVVIGGKTHYAVFNCRNKHWTKMKELPYNEYNTKSPGIYYNGSLYWVLSKWSENFQDSKSKIIRFDPRDDKFKEVQKPNGIQNNESLYLVLLGGYLCLYYNSRVQLFIMRKDIDRDLWMEFITIDVVPSMNYLQPLFMTDESEIVLFVDSSQDYFLVYNPSKISFAKIKIHSIDIKSIVYPFVESLLLGTGRYRRFRRPRPFEELREVPFLR